MSGFAQNEEDLRARLEREHSLAGHPKARNLFAIAWELGHSSGIEGVAYYYGLLSPLLDPHPTGTAL